MLYHSSLHSVAMAMEVDTPYRQGMLPNGSVNRELRNELGHSWSNIAQGEMGVDAHGRRQKTVDEERLEYFGKPRYDMRQGVGDDVDDENRVLPYAYEGRNPHIEKIMFAALTEADQIWTREIAPITKMTNLGNQVEVAQYIFNKHLVDRVPEQGVVRLVTSYKRRWTEAMIRVGLGLMMEDGFAMTNMGKMHYNQHLLQIRDALLNALRLMVIDRILSVPRQATNFSEAAGMPLGNHTMLQVLEREAEQWATLQKNEHAFLKLRNMGEEALAQNQYAQAPDTLILPYGQINNYRWKHPEETEFSKAGPSGPGLLSSKGGPIGALATKFEVLEFPRCFVGEGEPMLDPSSRQRVIGEFFQMSHKFSSTVRAKKWRKELMNITVHDNDSDQMVELEYRTYLKASGLWNSDAQGSLSNLGRQFFAGCATFDEWLRANNLYTDFVASLNAKNLGANANGLGFLANGAGGGLPPVNAQAGGQAPEQGALRARVETPDMAANVSAVMAMMASLQGKYKNIAKLCVISNNPEYKVETLLPAFEDIAVVTLVDAPGPDGVLVKRSGAGGKFLALLDGHAARLLAVAPTEDVMRKVSKLGNLFRGVLVDASKPTDTMNDIIAKVLAPRNQEQQLQILEDVINGAGVPSAGGPIQFAERASSQLKLADFTWNVVEKLYQADVRLPFNLLLFRPFMTYQMGSAAMLKRGVGTMQTLLGNENFMLSRDGSRKMLLGNYTVYTGVAVVAPENIYVMDNVSCQNYLGGGGIVPHRADQASTSSRQGKRAPADIFVIVIPSNERISSQVRVLTLLLSYWIFSHNHNCVGYRFWISPVASLPATCALRSRPSSIPVTPPLASLPANGAGKRLRAISPTTKTSSTSPATTPRCGRPPSTCHAWRWVRTETSFPRRTCCPARVTGVPMCMQVCVETGVTRP